MRINPNSEVPGPAAVPPARSKPTANTQAADVDLAASSDLTRSIENISLVRINKVAQAKMLLRDPAYPGDATLEKVADVLANHLGPQRPPTS